MTVATTSSTGKVNPAPLNLGTQVYGRVKEEIFSFVLLPGDRFTEAEIAARMSVSRTPVREALYRLEREGFLEVLFRAGWRVKPFDFKQFDDLYDLRITLETAAVMRLAAALIPPSALVALKAVWTVPAAKRLRDSLQVAALDERFHLTLVEATGNAEAARVHQDITERIRIVRRLDFSQGERIDATYREHGRILQEIFAGDGAAAAARVTRHIEASKANVHTITLHMLHGARVGVQR